MSVKATNWAWEKGVELDLPRGPRFTLVRVADHADNDGICWPGTDAVALYTGTSDKSVREHLKALENDHDLLHRERVSVRPKGRGRSVDAIVLHLDQAEATSGRSGEDGGDSPESGSQGAGGEGADQAEATSGRSEGDQPEVSDGPTGSSGPDQPEVSDPALHREPIEPSEEPGNDAPQDLPTPTRRVFDCWVEVTGRSAARTKFSPERQRLITRAITVLDFSAEELCDAIQAYQHSPFHQGDNDRNRPFNDLEHFIRDAKTIETWLALAENHEKGGGSWGDFLGGEAA